MLVEMAVCLVAPVIGYEDGGSLLPSRSYCLVRVPVESGADPGDHRRPKHGRFRQGRYFTAASADICFNLHPMIVACATARHT